MLILYNEAIIILLTWIIDCIAMKKFLKGQKKVIINTTLIAFVTRLPLLLFIFFYLYFPILIYFVVVIPIMECLLYLYAYKDIYKSRLIPFIAVKSIVYDAMAFLLFLIDNVFIW